MRTLVTLKKSPIKAKKMTVVVVNKNGRKKTIHFGATGYSDYTIHKDPARRDRYDARHRSRENWKDPMTAGFWAKWILWNKPTINASIRDTAKRFNLKISRG